MSAEAGQLRLIGSVSKFHRRACMRAAGDAGFLPSVIVRTGEHRMVAFSDHSAHMLFMVWPGRQLSRLSWSLDPACFSRSHKADTWRAVMELLADCEVPNWLLRVRRKNSLAVS